MQDNADKMNIYQYNTFKDFEIFDNIEILYLIIFYIWA